MIPRIDTLTGSRPIDDRAGRTRPPATVPDAKTDRICASWLGGDLADAHWLASVADEVVVAAGTSIGGARFVHLLLDEDAGCRLVGLGVQDVTVERTTRVLVLPEAESTEAIRRYPVLADAWAASLTRCAAAV